MERIWKISGVSWRRLLAALGVAVLAIGVLLPVVLIAVTPSPRALKDSFPTRTAFIERERAAGQRVLWAPVPYELISDELKVAVLVSEDIGFFHHHGFEGREIRDAIHSAIQGKKLRGASTLTQQLAKNLWLSPRRSILRKLEEAVLAWKLEVTLKKRRILELYLNCVEFGPGIFGAEAASEYYFEKPAGQLTRGEAAQLAAALPSPSHRHPGARSRSAQQAIDRILYRMKRAGWLRKLL